MSGARHIERAGALRRFKPYPAYKDSGVEWLREIPAHWEVKMLKRLAAMQSGSAITSESIEPTGDYPVFGGNGIRGFTDSYTHEGSFPLIGRQGALCGCVSLASGKFWASEHAVVARPAEFVDALWLAELLAAMSLNNYSQSAAQPGLAVETIGGIRAPAPPVAEQRAIAAFLDRETARIDALVAKKERLIELLQEQRTALITRAVTKGLDPNVPLKDSGVEWLGEIARHWEVKRIKFIAQVGNGSTPNRENAEYWGGDYPWLNSSVVNLAEVTEGSDFVTALALRECHLPRIHPPAVLVGITGEGRTRGMATVLRIEATINQHLAFIRPTRAHSDAEYIRYSLYAAYQFLRDESGGGGSTKGALTCDQLGSVSIPFPPLAEQRAIAAFLDRETARIDALVAKVRDAIDRLKQLRTALISAAVTGKIDVREEVA